MRNIWTIARKEINSYFRSPIAYSVIAMFALIFGYFYYQQLSMFILQSLTQAQYAQMYGQEAPPMNVNDQVIRPLLYTTGVLCLFLVPMITMRLFAEEKKSGTIELLMTSPVTDVQIIFGKFFAALFLYLVMLSVTLLHFLVLFRYGFPDWKPMAAGYLGQILMGCCFLSIGLLFSTFTRNQVIAGSMTFFSLLLLWVLDISSQYSGSWWGSLAHYVALTPHMENFSKGVLDFKDAIYYLSVIALGLFFSVRSVESVRWRA
jgi:gliding motility-associated transport system permease protein